MNNKGLIIFGVSLFLFASKANSQVPVQSNYSTTNLRAKRIQVVTDTTIVDTLSIVPQSFSILGVNDSTYRVDYFNSLLVWKHRITIDSVDIVYRVFPYRITAETQHMKYDNVMNRYYVKPFEFNKKDLRKSNHLFDFGDVEYNGSFGRSITTGNNQDVVLNSNFNLSINGMLGDSIEINAAITDNNIPIQPDGTTQQLNEFDQIFLQFKKRNWKLNFGDIDIRQKQHYFLNFYKRLQGASFENKNLIGANSSSSTLVSASIAKGKFTRDVFQGLEGNQGPYRLKGANNELYFILLAGTERVFLDGEMLQRGEDQDYVINYNSAELIFTPKRMITKDSRIQVEFEYADRNYLNTNFYVAQEFELNKKLKLSFAAFDNSDVKHAQLNQVLSGGQKTFLTRLGDSIQKAFYPSVVEDSVFDAEKILYEKIYFNSASGLDSFYQYSKNSITAKYSLSFTDVGEGNGNYVTNFAGTNGRVFKFLLPIAGIKQGRFEPILLLVTPKKQQLITLASVYKISANSELKTELAFSNFDVNSFSKYDSGDDWGKAAKLSFNNISTLTKNAPQKIWLKTDVDYEYVQDKFKPLERLRQVEFLRDWGIENQTTSTTENIIQVSAKVYDQKNNSLTYQFSNYNRSDKYKGFQQKMQQISLHRGWKFNNQFFISSFNNAINSGKYERPIFDISRELPKLNGYLIGMRYSAEKQQVKNKISDSLTRQSFSFSTYSVYLKSSEKKKNKHSVNFFKRIDQYPVGTKFISGDKSTNINVQTELIANAKHQFIFNSTFRKLEILNPISKQKRDETVLGRFEYLINEWKGLVIGNVLYELGTGQEQKRDFVFLEVPAGTGQFVWRDYNMDGAQQLNEFEEALFTDQAKYIRIYTPSNEFIKANFTAFNYSLRLNPRAVLIKSEISGLKKLVSKTAFSSSLQVNKKSVAMGSAEFNPFKNKLTDTSLITLNTISVNTFSFNRFSNKWGFDLSVLKNNGKYLLTYGYESKKIEDWILKFRWNILQSILLDLQLKKGVSGLYSPKFNNRNFELNIFNLEPKLVFINGARFRIATSYKFENTKNNIIYGGEKSISNSIQMETKYNLLQNTSVSGKLSVHKIDYPFATNSTVSYIMLNGLLPGNNYLWGLDFTKRILNNMELSFQYEGRKSGEARIVNIGRASIRALF